MDPNEALKNAREAAAFLLSPPLRTEGSDVIKAAATLAEAFEALDGWLSKGGFLPHGWSPRKREQTTEEG